MTRIPQPFLNELLSRTDIVDIIDKRIKLKKTGSNYVAKCPFHSEKSPSFSVSQTKQFYHCFGCGAHGDAIGFLMEYSGLGYIEAIKELAEDFDKRSGALMADGRRTLGDISRAVNNFDRNPSRVIFGGGNNAPPPAEATATTSPRGANAAAPPRAPSGQKRQ